MGNLWRVRKEKEKGKGGGLAIDGGGEEAEGKGPSNVSPISQILVTSDEMWMRIDDWIREKLWFFGGWLIS